MKPKIFIFGDSYSADYGPELGWVKHLEKDLNLEYEIYNFSVVGTGPTLLFDDLKKQIKTINASKDDILIFVLPDVQRVNLSFVSRQSDQTLTTATKFNSSGFLFHAKQRFGNKNLKFVLKFNEYYSLHSSNLENEYMKYFSYLSVIGQQHFNKTLVIPTVPLPDDIDITIFQKIDNFYLSDILIQDISENESKENKAMLRTHGGDSRTNHLNQDNKIELKNQVISWIKNNTPLDYKKFNIKS